MVKRGRRRKYHDFSRVYLYDKDHVLKKDFIEKYNSRKRVKFGRHLIMAGWYGVYNKGKKKWTGSIAIFTKSFELIKDSKYFWSEEYIMSTVNHEVMHGVIEPILVEMGMMKADNDYLHWPFDRGLDDDYYLEHAHNNIDDPKAFRSCPVIYG